MEDRGRFAKTLVERSLAEFLDDSCPQLAAAISYHVLFSIFPLLIVVAGVTGIVVSVTGTQADVVDALVRQVPLSASGSDRLRRLLEGTTGHLSALGLLGIVGLLYAAAGMMASIRTALNRAWDVDEPRPYLKGRLVDVGLVFAVALSALASFGLTIGVGTVTGGWDGAGVVLAILLPLVLAFATSLFLYRVVPAADVRLADAWPAALFVAGGFVAAQNLFAVYVAHFAHYNAIYGSLGAVIAFMFYVYLSSLILLLGAEVASEWPRTRRALERGEVEEGPPLSVQVKQILRGLWVRERKRERPDAAD